MFCKLFTHLPGTREASIVKEDVTLGEDTWFTVLLVLLDGVTSLIGSNLELSAGVLGAVGTARQSATLIKKERQRNLKRNLGKVERGLTSHK